MKANVTKEILDKFGDFYLYYVDTCSESDKEQLFKVFKYAYLLGYSDKLKENLINEGDYAANKPNN